MIQHHPGSIYVDSSLVITQIIAFNKRPPNLNIKRVHLHSRRETQLGIPIYAGRQKISALPADGICGIRYSRADYDTARADVCQNVRVCEQTVVRNNTMILFARLKFVEKMSLQLANLSH